MSKLSRAARNRRKKKQRKNGNNNGDNPTSVHIIGFDIDKVALEKLFKFHIIDHPYDSYPIATVADQYLTHFIKIKKLEITSVNELRVRKKIYAFLTEVDKKTDRYRPKAKSGVFQLDEKNAKSFFIKFCKDHPRIKLPTNRASRAATEYLKAMEIHENDLGSHNIIFRFFKGIDALLQSSVI